MLSITELLAIDTKQIWLKISQIEQDRAWQQAQHHSNPIACFNALLNDICLRHFIKWLEEWIQEESMLPISVWPSQKSLPSIWEVVNGTAIQMGETRLVLVPSETLYLEELRVPQEWVDIPSWTADYYIAIAVQVDLDDDDNWIVISGFATHRQLKNQSIYDKCDRTYSLKIDQLTENITLLLVTLGLHLQEDVPSLKTLSEAKARELLLTLGDVSIYSPRLKLDVPFDQWAVIFANEQWRQQLYDRRLGCQEALSSQASTTTTSTTSAALSTPYSVLPNGVLTSGYLHSPPQNTVVNLNEWFQQVFEAGWQSVDELFNTRLGNLAFDVRSFSISPENPINGVKLIDLGMDLSGQTLVLLLAISQEIDEKIGVLVQVHPTGQEKYLPSHLKLMLLESGNVVQTVQSRSQDYLIQLNRFKGLRGACFTIQLALDNFNMTEDFYI